MAVAEVSEVWTLPQLKSLQSERRASAGLNEYETCSIKFEIALFWSKLCSNPFKSQSLHRNEFQTCFFNEEQQ